MKKSVLASAILVSLQLIVPYSFAATQEEIKQFIDWKAQQPDPFLHKGTIGEIWVKQGITNPYTDANIIKSAESSIDRADRSDAAYVNAGKAPLPREWLGNRASNTVTATGVVGASPASSSIVIGPSPAPAPSAGTITVPTQPLYVGPAPTTSSSISKEEIKQFIDWKAQQYNPLGTQGTIGETWAKQGITDPYNDPNIIKSAEFSINRANARDATYIKAGKDPLPREWAKNGTASGSGSNPLGTTVVLPTNVVGNTVTLGSGGNASSVPVGTTGKTLTSKEEIRKFIDWQGKQYDPTTGKLISESWAKRGITDPYNDPGVIKGAEFSINRADRRDNSYINAGKDPLPRAWLDNMPSTTVRGTGVSTGGTVVSGGSSSGTGVVGASPSPSIVVGPTPASSSDFVVGPTGSGKKPTMVGSSPSTGTGVVGASPAPSSIVIGPSPAPAPTGTITVPMPDNRAPIAVKPGVINPGMITVPAPDNRVPTAVKPGIINPGTITMPAPDNRVPTVVKPGVINPGTGVVGATPSPSIVVGPTPAPAPSTDFVVGPTPSTVKPGITNPGTGVVGATPSPSIVVGPTPAPAPSSDFVVGPTPSTGTGVVGATPSPSVTQPNTVTTTEVNKFIEWQGKQNNPLGTGTIGEGWAKQGIKDPYKDPNVIKGAEFVINRANRKDEAYVNAGKSPLPRAWLGGATAVAVTKPVAEVSSAIVIGPSSGAESTDDPFVVGPTGSSTAKTGTESKSVFCGTGAAENCGWLLKGK